MRLGQKNISLKKKMAETNTKQFVEIREIRDDSLILKDGSLRQIIRVSSTNFELKSQDEQLAILSGFREFLNTLDFSLEIMVMSRKLNIDKYLAVIDEIIENQTHDLLRIQAVDYAKFVKELTSLANIMAKDFFVVVPFYIGPRTEGGILETAKSIFKPAETVKSLTDSEFNSYKNQLRQRVNLVFENIAGLNLAAKILEKDELIDIYYRFYNPEVIKGISKINNQ